MKIFKLTALLICAVFLFGCSKMEYSDDKSCRELGEGIEALLDDSQEYSEFDGAHVDIYFDDSAEYDDLFAVYSTDNNDINEFGVFHAPNANVADDLLESCREYVEDMREGSRAFIASYAPGELPKLDGAEVRRFGNYVVYTVLSDSDAQAVFDYVKAELEE